MSSRATSLEPKSQLAINLDPRRESPSLSSEESKRRKFSIKDRKKAKEENSQPNIGGKQKRRKIPDQRSEENKRNIQKGPWTRQYLNNTEFSVRKLKRPIAPFLGKFSTLSQQEKEKPLLRGHCRGVFRMIPYKNLKRMR